MPLDPIELVSHARRRMALALALGEGLVAGAVLLALAGALALVLRRFAGWSVAEAAWLGLVLLLVPPVVAWRGRGRWPTRSLAATWVDVQAGGGGWVVSQVERPDPTWAERARAALPALQLPPWRLRRPAAGFALGVSFFAVVLAIDLAPPVPPSARTAHPAEALQAQAEALEEAVLMPPEQVAALDQALESLASADPTAEGTLEAADALAEALARAAESAADAAQQAREALASAGDAPAEALAQAALALALGPEAPADPGPVPRLPPELASALSKAASEAAQGQPLESGPAQELAEALQEALDAQQLKLVEARLAEADALAAAGEGVEAGDGEPTGTGQGAPLRGPGAAPLRFGGESPEDGALFQPQALPSARYLDMEGSVVVQEGLAAPGVDPRAEGGAGATAADPGAATGRRPLSPSQRRAVSAFFGAGRD